MPRDCDDMLEKLEAHERSCAEKHTKLMTHITQLEGEVKVQNAKIDEQNIKIDALFRELRFMRWAMIVMTPVIFGVITLEEYVRALLRIGGG